MSKSGLRLFAGPGGFKQVGQSMMKWRKHAKNHIKTAMVRHKSESSGRLRPKTGGYWTGTRAALGGGLGVRGRGKEGALRGRGQI